MTRTSSRRALLAGACAACAAALAGCARYGTSAGLAGAPPGAPAYGGSPTAAGTGSAGGSAANVLASTADVPVGGGTIITAQRIVITQPQAGSYHAFTAICTHLGCLVNSVSGGTINCPCHGSKYSIVNGSVVNGPASLPLAAVSIKVEGTSIVKALPQARTAQFSYARPGAA
jgi:Rieske Fe-S protein